MTMKDVVYISSLFFVLFVELFSLESLQIADWVDEPWLFSGDIPTVPWFSVSRVCRRRIKKKQRQDSESHHLLYPSLAENLRWPITVHLFYA